MAPLALIALEGAGRLSLAKSRSRGTIARVATGPIESFCSLKIELSKARPVGPLRSKSDPPSCLGPEAYDRREEMTSYAQKLLSAGQGKKSALSRSGHCQSEPDLTTEDAAVANRSACSADSSGDRDRESFYIIRLVLPT